MILDCVKYIHMDVQELLEFPSIQENMHCFSPFFERSLDRVFKFFKTDPIIIAKKIGQGEKVFPPQIRRLIHEGGYQELQILQQSLPP